MVTAAETLNRNQEQQRKSLTPSEQISSVLNSTKAVAHIAAAHADTIEKVLGYSEGWAESYRYNKISFEKPIAFLSGAKLSTQEERAQRQQMASALRRESEIANLYHVHMRVARGEKITAEDLRPSYYYLMTRAEESGLVRREDFGLSTLETIAANLNKHAAVPANNKLTDAQVIKRFEFLSKRNFGEFESEIARVVSSKQTLSVMAKDDADQQILAAGLFLTSLGLLATGMISKSGLPSYVARTAKSVIGLGEELHLGFPDFPRLAPATAGAGAPRGAKAGRAKGKGGSKNNHVMNMNDVDAELIYSPPPPPAPGSPAPAPRARPPVAEIDVAPVDRMGTPLMDPPAPPTSPPTPPAGPKTNHIRTQIQRAKDLYLDHKGEPLTPAKQWKNYDLASDDFMKNSSGVKPPPPLVPRPPPAPWDRFSPWAKGLTWIAGINASAAITGYIKVDWFDEPGYRTKVIGPNLDTALTDTYNAIVGAETESIISQVLIANKALSDAYDANDPTKFALIVRSLAQADIKSRNQTEAARLTANMVENLVRPLRTNALVKFLEFETNRVNNKYWELEIPVTFRVNNGDRIDSARVSVADFAKLVKGTYPKGTLHQFNFAGIKINERKANAIAIEEKNDLLTEARAINSTALASSANEQAASFASLESGGGILGNVSQYQTKMDAEGVIPGNVPLEKLLTELGINFAKDKDGKLVPIFSSITSDQFGQKEARDRIFAKIDLYSDRVDDLLNSVKTLLVHFVGPDNGTYWRFINRHGLLLLPKTSLTEGQKDAVANQGSIADHIAPNLVKFAYKIYEVKKYLDKIKDQGKLPNDIDIIHFTERRLERRLLDDIDKKKNPAASVETWLDNHLLSYQKQVDIYTQEYSRKRDSSYASALAKRFLEVTPGIPDGPSAGTYKTDDGKVVKYSYPAWNGTFHFNGYDKENGNQDVAVAKAAKDSGARVKFFENAVNPNNPVGTAARGVLPAGALAGGALAEGMIPGTNLIPLMGIIAGDVALALEAREWISVEPVGLDSAYAKLGVSISNGLSSFAADQQKLFSGLVGIEVGTPAYRLVRRTEASKEIAGQNVALSVEEILQRVGTEGARLFRAMIGEGDVLAAAEREINATAPNTAAREKAQLLKDLYTQLVFSSGDINRNFMREVTKGVARIQKLDVGKTPPVPLPAPPPR